MIISQLHHEDGSAKLHLTADDLERLRQCLDWAVPESPTPTRVVGLVRLREIRDVIADAQRRLNGDELANALANPVPAAAPFPAAGVDRWDDLPPRPTFGQAYAGQPDGPIQPPPDSLFTGARGITYYSDVRSRAWAEYRAQVLAQFDRDDRSRHLPPQVD